MIVDEDVLVDEVVPVVEPDVVVDVVVDVVADVVVDVVVEDVVPPIVVLVEVLLSLGSTISKHPKSEPTSIEIIKIYDKSLIINLFFIRFSLFLYTFPIFLGSAFGFVVTERIISFIF